MFFYALLVVLAGLAASLVVHLLLGGVRAGKNGSAGVLVGTVLGFYLLTEVAPWGGAFGAALGFLGFMTYLIGHDIHSLRKEGK